MRLIVVVLLLMAAGILAVGAYWTTGNGTRPVTLPGGPAPAPTAIPVPDAAPKAQALKGEVSLEITEAQLTGALEQQLVGRDLGQTPLGRATIERIQASLRNGRAEVSGTAQLGGSSVQYSTLLTLTPDADGRARVRVTEARVASLPMPDSARAQVEATIQAQLDRLLAARPMRVRSIEIGDGRMRVIGTPTG